MCSGFALSFSVISTLVVWPGPRLMSVTLPTSTPAIRTGWPVMIWLELLTTASTLYWLPIVGCPKAMYVTSRTNPMRMNAAMYVPVSLDVWRFWASVVIAAPSRAGRRRGRGVSRSAAAW